jgi:hypothetical protein
LFVAETRWDDFSRTKDDASTDFTDPSPCTRLVDLGITQVRVQPPTRVFARSTSPTSSRWRFRHTVVGDERFDRRRPLVTGQHWGSAIRAGLQRSPACRRLFRAAVMGEMSDPTPMTGQRDRPPAPGITEMAGIVWLKGCLFFLPKVQRASLCACVTCQPRMQCVLTAAACWPAQSNQWRTV